GLELGIIAGVGCFAGRAPTFALGAHALAHGGHQLIEDLLLFLVQVEFFNHPAHPAAAEHHPASHPAGAAAAAAVLSARTDTFADALLLRLCRLL
ncbi:MAG: hypothetical protein HZB38_15895, partial [Planctomycetes bacterium]|nr:hypothetical protein [Planctomycetota bacterium]